MCYFRFGIPSLDELINPNVVDFGYFNTGDEPGVICIFGPDGVGKSILALHAASTYLADSYPHGHPAVVYVSTDLKHSQARRNFEAFGLNTPAARARALKNTVASNWRPEMHQETLELKWVCPKRQSEVNTSLVERGLEPESIASYMGPSAAGGFRWDNRLLFLDLVTSSSGDDWNAINRMMGFLTNFPLGDPHLMIVDAVEGLEANVGEVDSFGQMRNRRSRIAQLIRLAKCANCHLLLIIEEANTAIRLPEEFVADLVIRLRVAEKLGYTRRTIEIEKARGVAHIRGQHDIVTRLGTGTMTVDGENPDDPYVYLRKPSEPEPEPNTQSDTQLGLPTIMSQIKHLTLPPRSALPAADQTRPMCYMQVFQSLHAWERTRVQSAHIDVGPHGAQPGRCLFDSSLQLLNVLLRPPGMTQSDAGSVTALIGDPGTYKSRLGRSFLSTAFTSTSDGNGVAVLIATYSIGPSALGQCFSERGVFAPREKLIVRHISPHFMTSSGLFFLLEKTLERAHNAIGTWSENILERRERAWRIHFVLDDWNVLLTTHPNLAGDSALLQTLLQFFQREGVTALLIATQPGSPSFTSGTNVPHDLKSVDTAHIYTWPVQFFGSRRTAITTFPAPSPLDPPLVYELRPSVELMRDYFHPEILTVDRHFALYATLEEGRPQRIPLHVRLYSGYHTLPEVKSDKPLYIALVKDLFHDLYPTVAPGPEVVRFDHIEQYTDFAEFVQLLDGSRLDHTLVFQMDEFWKSDDLADLGEYLDAVTATISVRQLKDKEGKRIVTWSSSRASDEDPDEAFQPLPPAVASGIDDEQDKSGESTSQTERTRSSFFNSDDYSQLLTSGSSRNRIPYSWDFGFLLARRDLWWKARHNPVNYRGWHTEPGESVRVGDVWNSLCVDNARFRDIVSNTVDVSWALFFETCRVVKGDLNVPAFDVDLRTSETLCALVLEIWFSEISGIIESRQSEQGFLLPTSPTSKDTDVNSRSLRWWAQNTSVLMYYALVELMEAAAHLKVEGSQPALRSANPDSVAARHWYATASVANRGSRCLVPLRNPGRFSARGDWFLALALGSRSQLLGCRAIDKLSSRRMSILRLHDGLGLPARDVVDPSQINELRTALDYRDPDSDESKPITYGDLKKIGASGGRGLRWLWRSGIRDYDRHSFFFFRWLGRVLQNRDQILASDRTTRGAAYKQVFEGLPSEYQPHSSTGGDLRSVLRSAETLAMGRWCEFETLQRKMTEALRNTPWQFDSSDAVSVNLIAEKLKNPLENGIVIEKVGELVSLVNQFKQMAGYQSLRFFKRFIDDRDVLISVLREAEVESQHE